MSNTFRELQLDVKGLMEPRTPLSVAHIHKAIQKLKEMNYPEVLFKSEYVQYWDSEGHVVNSYHQPVVLEHKDIDMAKKFQEIDEKIKKDWGK